MEGGDWLGEDGEGEKGWEKEMGNLKVPSEGNVEGENEEGRSGTRRGRDQGEGRGDLVSRMGVESLK